MAGLYIPLIPHSQLSTQKALPHIPVKQGFHFVSRLSSLTGLLRRIELYFSITLLYINNKRACSASRRTWSPKAPRNLLFNSQLRIDN